MSLYALLRSKPSSTAEEIEAGLDGNLCRCTGGTTIDTHHTSNRVGCCFA